MPASTLFAYTVEDQDGKLVITVGGVLAQRALQELRQGLESEGAGWLPTLLSPIKPLRRLLSAPIALRHALGAGPASADDPGSTEDILSQGVDQTLSSFQEQVAEFRKTLESLRRERPGEAAASRQPGAE